MGYGENVRCQCHSLRHGHFWSGFSAANRSSKAQRLRAVFKGRSALRSASKAELIQAEGSSANVLCATCRVIVDCERRNKSGKIRLATFAKQRPMRALPQTFPSSPGLNAQSHQSSGIHLTASRDPSAPGRYRYLPLLRFNSKRASPDRRQLHIARPAISHTYRVSSSRSRLPNRSGRPRFSEYLALLRA